MLALIWYGGPILLGVLCGAALTLPVNIAISAIAIAVAGSMFWQTRNGELESIMGIVALMVAAIFVVSLWLTIGAVEGVYSAINFSWLARS